MNGTTDCCPGEPCMGDPRGMHSGDCPVYLRWADAHEAAQRERFRNARLGRLVGTLVSLTEREAVLDLDGDDRRHLDYSKIEPA